MPVSALFTPLFWVYGKGHIMLRVCDLLHENDPHKPRHLNTWFPVDGAVWRGLGGTALRKYANSDRL